jgi:hypothetical protein
LTPDDSGTADHPLKLAAYPGEHPILDGGMTLPATWQKQDHGSLWTLQVPALPHPVEDLFVNGKKQPRSRFPQTGFLRALTSKQPQTQFTFKQGELQAWPDAAKGILVIKSREWWDEILPIKSIDETTLTVTLASKSLWSLSGDGEGKSGDYYIENVIEGLNQAGEWCLDPIKRELTFWPPDGVDPNRSEIVAGGIPLMVSATGDVPNHKWVEHVIFDGLTFTHAGRFDTTDMVNGSALCLNSGVRNCEVRNCRVLDVGGCGVALCKECQNNLISGCEFSGVGENSVKISDFYGQGPMISSGNVVENNTIHDSATLIRHLGAIELADTGHNRIAHNLIFTMPCAGIVVDGDRPEYWDKSASPDLPPPYTAASIKPFIPTLGNIIEFNHIHHVEQYLADGGGIYLWGVMGNGANIVRNNLVEHVGSGQGAYVGIYLDDYCEDVQVTDNVFIDTNLGLQLHGAPRNILDNNVFAYSRESDIFVQPEQYNTPPMQTVLRHNIYFQCAGNPFADTSWAPWKMLPLSECDNNIYWQDGKTILLGKGTFAGFDQNSQVADPKFVDPANGDFSLGPDSPATQLGIHTINLKGVGPVSNPSP